MKLHIERKWLVDSQIALNLEFSESKLRPIVGLEIEISNFNVVENFEDVSPTALQDGFEQLVLYGELERVLSHVCSYKAQRSDCQNFGNSRKNHI